MTPDSKGAEQAAETLTDAIRKVIADHLRVKNKWRHNASDSWINGADHSSQNLIEGIEPLLASPPTQEAAETLKRAAGQASFCLRTFLPNDPDAQMTVRMLEAALASLPTQEGDGARERVSASKEARDGFETWFAAALGSTNLGKQERNCVWMAWCAASHQAGDRPESVTDEVRDALTFARQALVNENSLRLGYRTRRNVSIVSTFDEAITMLDAALASLPTQEVDGAMMDADGWHNFNVLQYITNWLLERNALLTPHTEESGGSLAAGMNIVESFQALIATPPPTQEGDGAPSSLSKFVRASDEERGAVYARVIPAAIAMQQATTALALLSGMVRDTTNMERAQPGYQHAEGWNAALRQAMDYVRGGALASHQAGDRPESVTDEARDGWKLLKDSTQGERSFHEDEKHENGCYFNSCCNCLRIFTGHKRRVICKVCAAIASTSPEGTQP